MYTTYAVLRLDMVAKTCNPIARKKPASKTEVRRIVADAFNTSREAGGSATLNSLGVHSEGVNNS